MGVTSMFRAVLLSVLVLLAVAPAVAIASTVGRPPARSSR